MKNQRGQRCQKCGGWVAEGDGTLERRSGDGSGPDQWLVTHADGCPAVGEESAGDDAPRWAVYCRGRTPGGNQSAGVRLVDAAERPVAGILPAAPVTDAAQALPELELVAAGSPEGRRWIGYWWLRGLRPRPSSVSDDALLDIIGDGIEDMDRRVAEERRRVLER